MLANVRVFIIIGDEPSSTKDKKTYENYDLLSTAQLIEKIMKEVFNIPQKDIITFAYGNHKKYMDLLEKTQRKLITQISHEEILYQVPSDLSGYIFFENKESLYKLIIKFSILHQNTDLFLFILDHGNIGSIIKIPYIQIYQATLNGFPKSIRIFNDCCHGGSIITSIEQYSRFYNKVKLTREKVSMNPPFDLHFIPDYVMMARKMSYNIFFSEIKWLTAFCEVRNSQKFEVFVDDFCKKNYSLYKTLNPDLPVSDYIDDFVSNTNDLSDILTLINQVQIKTIGQLVAAIVFTLHRKFPKCRVSSITRDDANIFLKLCGENEKNVKRILITADKEAETKLILKLEEGKKITLEETKNDNNEFQLNLKTNQDTEIKLFFAVEQKDSNKIIQVEEDQEKGGEQVLGEEEEREQQQSLRLNIKPQQMEIERQPKKISQNINEEKNEKELKIIIKTEEKYEINLITFLEKNINSNTDLERKKFIQLILKEEQENIIKLMIKLEQESNTEIQQNLMPEHEYEIEFLTDVLNIDFESIYPPVSDRRIFASSGIYSKSFTFISTPISPRLKINAGSPGVSEAIHEIFLRNSDDSVDFHRIKTNLTISKDGKFKEHPLGTRDEKNHIHWVRFFPRHDSTDNFQYDRLLKIFQDDVRKKVSAMRGIRELVCNDLEALKISFINSINDIPEFYSLEKNHQKFKESKQFNFQETNKKNKYQIRKEKMNEVTSNARISENEIRMISAISLISSISFHLPIEKAIKYIIQSLPEEYAIVGIISRILGESIHQIGFMSINSIIQLLRITNEILLDNEIDTNSSARTFVIKSSNLHRLMLFSSILSIIITNQDQNFIKNYLNKLINKRSHKLCSFISQELHGINLDKIIHQGIHYIHELLNQELKSSVELLKGKIDFSINIVQNEIITFKQNLMISQIDNSEINQGKDETKDEEKEEIDLIRFKQSIHINVGSSIHLNEALLSILTNTNIIPKSKLSDEIINQISQQLLNIRNTIIENISNNIEQNHDSSIYEVIASKLLKIYDDQTIEKNIIRIISYKLREFVLDSTFFPRNPKDLQEIQFLFPNNDEKAIFLLINSLEELLKVIQSPFKFDEDSIERDANLNPINTQYQIHKQTYQKEQNQEYNNNNNKQQNESPQSIDNQYDQIQNNSQSLENEIEKVIANNHRRSHPYLGIGTAIKIISSYFVKNIPITIPMIENIDKVIHDFPQQNQIQNPLQNQIHLTENDILQLVGLGKFDTQPIKRIRYRENKLEELDFYSKDDSTLIKINKESDDYFSDDGIFNDNIQTNESKNNNDDYQEIDKNKDEDEEEKEEDPYNYKSKLTEEEISDLRKEILANIDCPYTTELWIVFKELFTRRLEKKGYGKINLDFPTRLRIGESLEYQDVIEKIFDIVPLGHIDDFWNYKTYISEWANDYDERKVYKEMILSFDEADRIVTPRHSRGAKKRWADP